LVYKAVEQDVSFSLHDMLADKLFDITEVMWLSYTVIVVALRKLLPYFCLSLA
jgi:hypothetical protein